MRESTVITGWMAEGRLAARREDLLRALRIRFRTEVPAELAAAIAGSTDVDELTQWFDAALTAASLHEFRTAVQQ